MDDLDVELISVVVRQCALFMRPLLCLVSRKWSRAVSGVRQIDQHRHSILYDPWGRLVPPPPRTSMAFKQRKRYGYCPAHDRPLKECQHDYVLCLIDRGQSDLLAWIYDLGTLTLPRRAPEKAAAIGDIPLLVWLAEKGCKIGRKVSRKAARYGHQHILEWLQKAGIEQSKRVMAKALKGGHDQLFEWLYERRTEKDAYPYREAALVRRTDLLERFERDCEDHNGFSYGAFYGAAANGDARLIEWLHDRDYDVTPYACDIAAMRGHLAVFQQLLDLVPTDEVDDFLRRDVCNDAARKGQFHVIQWLSEKGWASIGDRILCAVCCKHSGGIAWLQGLGPVPTEHLTDANEALEEAARRGDVRMLAFLRGLGCAMSANVLRTALYGRQWVALQWIFEHATDDVFAAHNMLYKAALDNGQLAMVEWLWNQNGWPAPESIQLFAHATRNCDVGTLRWLRDRGCPWDASVPASTYMFKKSRRLKIVQWLYKHGCPFDARVSIDAAGYGDLGLLQWVVANGLPWHRVRCRKLCQQLHHKAMVEWIDAQPHGSMESDVRYDSFRPSVSVVSNDILPPGLLLWSPDD